MGVDPDEVIHTKIVLALLPNSRTIINYADLTHSQKVRIEKIRMEKPGWKDTEDSGDCLSE